MTAWAVVVLALAGSFAAAMAAAHHVANAARALSVPVMMFCDPDETAAMDRERKRLEANAEAASLLAELRLSKGRRTSP